MNIQLAEDFSSIQQVGVVHNSTPVVSYQKFTQQNWFGDLLFSIPGKERQVQNKSQPVSIDKEQKSKESVYSSFRDDVGIKTVAELDGVDVVTVIKISKFLTPVKVAVNYFRSPASVIRRCEIFATYHSKSLYIMVKKTCRKRLTALINTASRYSQASPDIISTQGAESKIRFSDETV